MKSIIDIVMEDINVTIENEVIKACTKVGVNVDKERLVQALTCSEQFYTEGYNEGYEEATKKYKQNWIPCSERLPDKDCRVLMTIMDGLFEKDGYKRYRKVLSGRYVDGEFYVEFATYATCIPLAWMPLPDPYDEEEE